MLVMLFAFLMSIDFKLEQSMKHFAGMTSLLPDDVNDVRDVHPENIPTPSFPLTEA